jgi:hypothetical protein
MQFHCACAVTESDEIAAKVVDTAAIANPRVILFCERWIAANGGLKADPNTGTQILMNVVARNLSALILQFQIEGHLDASLCIVSGKNDADDEALKLHFQQSLQQANWVYPANILDVNRPGFALVTDPLHGDVADAPGIVQVLVDLSDCFAAAFFNQLLMPV